MTGAPPRTLAGGIRWAAPLALAGTLLLSVVIADSSRNVGRSFPGFLFWDNGTIVAFHLEGWTGPQSDVPVTGRILEVDGRRFESGSTLLDYTARLGPGVAVQYRIRHGSAEHAYTVPTMRLDWGDYLATFGIYLANAALLLLVACVALLLRPDRASARALATASASLALVLTLSVDILQQYRFTILFAIAETLLPASLLFLAISFPTESRLTARGRRTAAGIGLALFALGVVQVALFRARPEWYERINAAVYALLAGSLVAILGSSIRALVSSRLPEARIQAGIVLAGGIAAAAPAAVLISASLLLDWSISYTWIVAFVPFLPLAVLYAAVYRDLLQAERFIRLTVGYGLASATVVIAYTLGLFAVDRLALAGAAHHPAAAFGAVVALALAMDPIRVRIQLAIDRVFFRTTADLASVLERSSTEFAGMREEAEIHDHLRRVLVDDLSFEWAEFSPPERGTAAAALAEPVEFRGELLGVIRCGPKRSGAPVSGAEREVVRGLASQASVALQNIYSLLALRKAQDELVRSERFAAIGEFAAAVAHGIRNPLSGIRAAAQIARERVREDTASAPLSDLITEVDRLDARVRSLVNFSRPYEPKMERVDLCNLLRELSRVLAARAEACDVTLRLELPRAGVSARVDPHLLEEAIHELAGNALNAMGRGGKLEIGLEADEQTASVRVSDTGPGVPPGSQSRVFDLFFTTRAEGTGMGLAAVKRSVESQGGQVCLESSGPRGTAFRIDLTRDVDAPG